MNLENMLREIGQVIKGKYDDSTYISRIGKSVERESRLEVNGGWGVWWNGKLLINGYRVSVWSDKNISEKENSDDYTTLWMYLRPLNCILKVVKMTDFMSYISHST